MATIGAALPSEPALLPYVPRLLGRWSPTGDDPRHMRVTGTVAFVDISGFTRLTERLARKGKVGAEEMSDILSATFAGLLAEAREDGADLVKWGGDAVLLLFDGPDHAARAARAAHRMRAALRVIGRVPTSSGMVVLRMSVGIHTGDFDFFLVGDPAVHRELLISGPAASTTADTEAAAAAGQIGLSCATAAALDARHLGPALGSGRLLRSAPPVAHQVAEPEPTRRLDPTELLPPPIRTHLLSGEVEPEHRLIAVAFVQFSGTDELLRSAGPEALAEALDHVVRNVQHCCTDHDVTFFETDINRDGGKIMLTAGAPRSSDHNEERMLRAARQILDRAGRLPLRIGINRGHVFAGDFGPPFRRTFSVKGDAINLAARVMGKAQPGEALATAEVVARSQTLFRTTELPPFLVKGKSHPVRAVEVGALLGARNDDETVLPLVAREVEMAVLATALEEVRGGSGRLVEIVGEAGIGKTRLVGELVSRAGLPVVTAACAEYESSTPYFPFRRLLRDILGVPADAESAQVAARLTARAVAEAPQLLPWLPLVALAMDIELPDTRETAELDEQFRKGRLEEAVTELLGRIVTTPTVVVVDDAHLMDDSSADLLQRLTTGLDGHPWLVLVTRRDEPSGFMSPPDGAAIRVRPEPLSPAAALHLVQLAREEHPLPAQAATALALRGGGNPMFLEALVRDAGRAGGTGDLPESVEGLVTSQIDRLHPADRMVLRYAGVLGITVDETALDALLEEHDARVPSGAMHRLADFLVRDRPGWLRFRNGLIRDVAYEGLPFRQRRVLHGQVGEALERTAQVPQSQCELLSLHFFHAGRHDKAWRYSVLAGERALAKYAHGEAAAFFSRAAQSSSYLDVSPLEVAAVYERLADSQWLLGLSDQAAEAYAEARRNVRGDPVRTAGIVEKEARIDQRRRKHTVAMQRISRGLRQLSGTAGPSAAVARSLLARRYAFSRFNQGRVEEALHWATTAAHEAEEAVDKDALAQAYEMLNFIYAGAGRPEPLPYGRLALQAYRELGNLPRQGHCRNNLAMQAFAAGRWDASVADLRRATDIFRRIGDTASEGNALYNQAELLVRQHRYDEAAALLPDVLRIARAVEDEELVALAERELGRTQAAAGDVDRAVATLTHATVLFGSLDAPSEQAATELALAEVLLDAGRTAAAGEALERSGALAADPAGVAGHRLVARWHLASGRPADARSRVLAGLSAARAGADLFEEGLLLAELATVATDPTEGEDALSRARTLLDPLGVVGVLTGG